MTEDDRLYLQFLQNNIARMNTNSVQAEFRLRAGALRLLQLYWLFLRKRIMNCLFGFALFQLFCFVSWMLYICNRNINSLECIMIL